VRVCTETFPPQDSPSCPQYSSEEKHNDLGNVREIQKGYKAEALSTFLGVPAPSAAPAVAWVPPADEMLVSPALFNYLNQMLQFCPTNPTEKDLMAQFATLNIGTRENRHRLFNTHACYHQLSLLPDSPHSGKFEPKRLFRCATPNLTVIGIRGSITIVPKGNTVLH
jgi:hypothetical protein